MNDDSSTATCPSCGSVIKDVSASDPDALTIKPCGHRIGARRLNHLLRVGRQRSGERD